MKENRIYNEKYFYIELPIKDFFKDYRINPLLEDLYYINLFIEIPKNENLRKDKHFYKIYDLIYNKMEKTHELYLKNKDLVNKYLNDLTYTLEHFRRDICENCDCKDGKLLKHFL